MFNMYNFAEIKSFSKKLEDEERKFVMDSGSHIVHYFSRIIISIHESLPLK